MKTTDFLDLIAVVIATAIAAFLIVACWSLLGGLATYLIAMLIGGTLLYVWSDNHEHSDEVMRPVKEGIAPTLNSRMGTGGNQVPVMVQPIGYQESSDVAHCLRSQPSKADKPDSTTYIIQNATRGKSQNGLGISQDDVSYTLGSLWNHAVAYPEPANIS